MLGRPQPSGAEKLVTWCGMAAATLAVLLLILYVVGWFLLPKYGIDTRVKFHNWLIARQVASLQRQMEAVNAPGVRVEEFSTSYPNSMNPFGSHLDGVRVSGATDSFAPLAAYGDLFVLFLRDCPLTDYAPLQDMRSRLGALEIRNAPLNDLTPLLGLHLTIFSVCNCPVRDLSPLRGQPLQSLYLEKTAVEDLSPLKGMRLRALYLTDSPVVNLSPLKDMPLMTLDLSRTKVTDLSPLAGMTIGALSLRDAPIADLSVLDQIKYIDLDLSAAQQEQRKRQSKP